MKVKVSLCFNRKIEVWRLQRVKSDLPVKLGDLTLPSFHSSPLHSSFNMCWSQGNFSYNTKVILKKKSSPHNEVKLN